MSIPPPLPHIAATAYLTPLREGGSLPGLVEADDLGTYVGAVGYDRSFVVTPEEAARIVWLDALVANVDRSVRNTNLLVWHRRLWAIDHGACLRFQHAWGRPEAFATAAYRYDDHVLAGSGDPRTVHDELAAQVSEGRLGAVLELVPDAWLQPDPDRPDPRAPVDPPAARRAYVEYLLARLEAAARWLP